LWSSRWCVAFCPAPRLRYEADERQSQQTTRGRWEHARDLFRKYILNAETQRVKSFYVTFRVMLKHSQEVAERQRSTRRTHVNAFGMPLRPLDGRR